MCACAGIFWLPCTSPPRVAVARSAGGVARLVWAPQTVLRRSWKDFSRKVCHRQVRRGAPLAWIRRVLLRVFWLLCVLVEVYLAASAGGALGLGAVGGGVGRRVGAATLASILGPRSTFHSVCWPWGGASVRIRPCCDGSEAC